MKTIGWLLTLLGSNAFTATLVAKRMYVKLDAAVNKAINDVSDWILENFGGFVGNAIDNAVGEIPFIGSIGDPVAGIIDDHLSEKMSEFVREFHGISEHVDAGGRATVDTLFYVAAAVFVIGVAVLITGYIRDAKKANRE